MRHLYLLAAGLIRCLVTLLRPGGARALVAENLLLRQQLIMLRRSRRRAPNLSPVERLLAGACSILLYPRRLARAAVIFRPSTLLGIHRALVRRKYRNLFRSHLCRRKPGPPGPSPELVHVIVETKERNPRFGCPRIASQVARVFGIEVDKDLVPRVLAKHYRPDARGGGPSWLARLGTGANGLWSADLFCCESVLLKTHWVMVVMDQFSRRIVGFAVQVIAIDGTAVCRMFNVSIVGAGVPSHLSTDNAPYFRFHQWCANLRILGIDHLRSVPGAPTSHPFIERLIGTIRREFLDHTLFWNETDLTRKLAAFVDYYNRDRAHAGVHGRTPAEAAGATAQILADFRSYGWKSCCGGLFQLPSAT
jgi:putative transposase